MCIFLNFVFANTFKWQIEKVVELGVLCAYCQQKHYIYQSFDRVPSSEMNQRDGDVEKFLDFF
jgi:hypothetical protein